MISIIGFNVLILVHELGHFFAGRLVGLRAERVSVGFGPSVISWVGLDTEYRLALFPIGGYVKFPNPKTSSQWSEALGLKGLSYPARCFVTLAGPLANVILAIALYSSLFGTGTAVVYQFQREQTPHLGAVNSFAEAQGFKAGDLIVAASGKTIRTFGELRRILTSSSGPVTVHIARGKNGEAISFESLPTKIEGLNLRWPKASTSAAMITVVLDTEQSRRAFVAGVQPTVGRFGTHSIWRAVALGFDETLWVLKAMKNLVGQWRAGTQSPEVHSVVKMTQVSARTYERGWAWFLSLIALFSMNLAVLNLLPLPGLDGGRLLVDVMEWVSGKQLDERVSLVIHGVGITILLAFITVVMAREVWDLIR